MLDDALDFQAGLRDKPVWQPLPDEVRAHLREPLPRKGQGPESVYRSFLDNVLPYTNGNRHPRFFGWVQGNGFPLAMLADMLAAGMNPHMAGFAQAPAVVEEQVLSWLTELMGMPDTASGLLVSGGSIANLLGLAVARHVGCGFDVRREGLHGDHPRLVVYGSTETHNWAQRSVELLGLGREGLRLVRVDADYRMDLDDLSRQIAEDRRAGLRPVAVIATAGSVNTGAIDDMAALRQLCDREALWLHVDGAFGALARLVPGQAARMAGIESADSLAFDLHKWMYLPFEIACVLVRDGQAHRDAFAMTASYIAQEERGVIAGGLPFADRGIELTRGFKALKAWMCLKSFGVDAFAEIIERNIAQAADFGRRVEAHPRLELLAAVTLNIVCFCYRSPLERGGVGSEELNRELLLRLQESGLAVVSSTRLGGRFALRCCIVNHRTRQADLDALLEAVVSLGDQLSQASASMV